MCQYLKRNLIAAADVLLRTLFRCHTRYKLLAGALLLNMFRVYNIQDCRERQQLKLIICRCV